MLVWKNMTDKHLVDVLSIAGHVHVDFPESPDVFAERLALFPQGCWVAVEESAAGGVACGYAITHPWRLGQPPALDTLLGTLPGNADCLYLHDVALMPEGRHAGLGGALVRQAQALAKRQAYRHMALVAVNHSAPYWQHQGFAPYEAASQALQQQLASYCDDARYLVMDVT